MDLKWNACLYSLHCTNKTDNKSINLQWNRSICPNKTHRISCRNLLPIFKRDKINNNKKKGATIFG